MEYVIAALAVPLFGFLSVIATGVFKSRSETRAARNEAAKTARLVSTVETNTSGFDGFPDRVDRKLDGIGETTARLESRLTRLEDRLTGHLEWHMKEGRKR